MPLYFSLQRARIVIDREEHLGGILGDYGAVSYILGRPALIIESTNGLEENRRNGDVF